ncbi:hypothetical protein [Mucilaginibacter arboris]|uniref:Uncharacterized protein n=1 Tax=Mucilaginibacter arboris TaxID=2682090 RepID=A0A7K1SRH9_9SPHI|nr:hypothetical protein [Mucilaginibacter arboris]MVN19928.1 hypothetical protein [Mucilaginibacter arboris]
MTNFLKYKDYLAKINFSGKEALYGNILGINDLVTFEGRSFKEVKNLFIKRLMTIWLLVWL